MKSLSMRHHLYRIVLSIVLSAFAAGGAYAACPAGKAQAGDLAGPAGRSVSVGRDGNSITLKARAPICVDDMIFVDPDDVDLELYWSATRRVKAPTVYRVPTRLAFLAELTRETFADLFEAQAKTAVSTGSLRPERFSFAVAGLDDGSAIVSSSAKSLWVPITPPGLAGRAVLYDPRGRATLTLSVPPDATLLKLNQSLRPGAWRLLIETVEIRRVATFTVVPALDKPPVAAWAQWSPDERLLAMACTNVSRYGLAALQGAENIELRAKLLWYWSDPQATSPCAEG